MSRYFKNQSAAWCWGFWGEFGKWHSWGASLNLTSWDHKIIIHTNMKWKYSLMFIFSNRLVNGEGFSWCFWLPINFCRICNILRGVPRKQINFLSPAVLFYFESSAFSFPKTRYQNILDGIIQYILWNTSPKKHSLQTVFVWSTWVFLQPQEFCLAQLHNILKWKQNNIKVHHPYAVLF